MEEQGKGINRMTELLWYIGYCEEFPSRLGKRVGPSEDWSRHVMYKAIKRGFVTDYRTTNHKYVIHSLRLTEAGEEYLATHDPQAYTYILGNRSNRRRLDGSATKLARRHAITTGFFMARKAGAEVLPDCKPPLIGAGKSATYEYQAGDPIYYTIGEIRAALKGDETLPEPKASRMLGVIVRGVQLYVLYYTGHTRMRWYANGEWNSVAAVQAMLNRSGFSCRVISQVIIGSNMSVAVKLMHRDRTAKSRYFVLDGEYNNCYFITDDRLGERLLSTIINPREQVRIRQNALAGYISPSQPTKEYDAVTEDGQRPILFNYQCDLLAIGNMASHVTGFTQPLIMICYDYQAPYLQQMTGAFVEVRSIDSRGDGGP